ncbi:MAG: hypothetical protein ACREJ6_10925, partial [Candidatus Methylomirabilis sp.]
EFFVIGGTIAGFVAALLSIMEGLARLRDRVRSAKERKKAVVVYRSEAEQPPRADQWDSKVPNASGYLLFDEIAVIVAAGILLNYFGLVLSLRLQSILYLDMTGTALVAFLLGPWWGAIVGLLSSSLVNWLLYPEPGADVIIFPWSLVNMAGALFWGFMARRAGFRKYLRSAQASTLSHIWYLVSFGVLGACVMSVPGTFVLAAVSKEAVLPLNPDLTLALKRVVAHSYEALQGQLKTLFGVAWGESFGWALQSWLQTCLRYIPDKTLSAAIALAVLKYGFPLFERELVLGEPGRPRPRDTMAAPLFLGCLYIPSFLAFVRAEEYRSAQYWPLWSVPWLIIVGGIVAQLRWGPSDTAARHACIGRHQRYGRALIAIAGGPAHDFCRRLMFATLASSTFFALGIIVLLAHSYRAAFNFFSVVYGFLLVMNLVSVAISQNLSVVHRDD